MIIKVIIKVIIKHCGSPLTLRLLSVYPSRPFEGGGRNRPIQLSREPLEFPPSPPPASASPSTSTSLSLLKGLLGDRLRASKLKNESLVALNEAKERALEKSRYMLSTRDHSDRCPVRVRRLLYRYDVSRNAVDVRLCFTSSSAAEIFDVGFVVSSPSCEVSSVGGVCASAMPNEKVSVIVEATVVHGQKAVGGVVDEISFDVDCFWRCDGERVLSVAVGYFTVPLSALVLQHDKPTVVTFTEEEEGEEEGGESDAMREAKDSVICDIQPPLVLSAVGLPQKSLDWLSSLDKETAASVRVEVKEGTVWVRAGSEQERDNVGRFMKQSLPALASLPAKGSEYGSRLAKAVRESMEEEKRVRERWRGLDAGGEKDEERRRLARVAARTDGLVFEYESLE